jgi:hypothetical protein
MDGDGQFTELNNGKPDSGLCSTSSSWAFGRSTNSTDVNYRFSPAVGVFGGYQFSNRRIRSIEQLNFGDPIPDREEGEQNNRLHAGRFGLRLRPMKAIHDHPGWGGRPRGPASVPDQRP